MDHSTGVAYMRALQIMGLLLIMTSMAKVVAIFAVTNRFFYNLWSDRIDFRKQS